MISRLVPLFVLAALNAVSATKDCSSLASLTVPDAALHSEVVTTSAFTPPGGKPIQNLPAFCRVTMLLTPTTDSKINVELWLPMENWNGKLFGTGNGGYAGSIGYSSLVEGIRAHFAMVGTDTGHTGGAEDATWALNHPEKIIDFGYRAIHLMTTNAKLLTKAFYGEPISHSYFSSCSNGGREALMEAERFPEDYNGILAGAPANFWTHLVSNSASNSQYFFRSSDSAIPASKLPAIQAAALKACDKNDGVSDSIIEDPAHCHFDTSVLLCHGPDSNTCLTAPQISTLNKLYTGGQLSNGKSFFPGYSPGGEASKGNWDSWITGHELGKGSMVTYGSQFFGNMVYNNPAWDFHQFQADRDVKAADDKLGSILNAINPDLRSFISHGGKLILYHGWEDAAISPTSTIHFYSTVQEKIGVPLTTKSVRLYMVPGMQHCFGGDGTYNFGQFSAATGDATHDITTALIDWVEHADAPAEIIASKPGTATTHPLCVYPATAHYKASGDASSAASYTCASDSDKR